MSFLSDIEDEYPVSHVMLYDIIVFMRIEFIGFEVYSV
jgi:hypothetical protein